MVKVVDFGIAKAKVPRTETQVGLLKGKYSYMSPEMIVDEPLDRRSDVFALGIVLWEALACRRLFEGDTGTTTMMQVLNAPRVPPSKWRPQVPRGLDEVVLKALEVDPGLRYQTAAELKNAIEDVIWQHRCSASHVRTFMHATFPDRMARRRHLIAQTDREELSAVDDAMLASLEEANATDSCEITTKQTTPPLQPVLPQYPRSKLRALTLPVGVAVVLAALAGSLIAMSETRSLPAAIEHVQMSVHGR
jgi:serine/threonine-protein kinase